MTRPIAIALVAMALMGGGATAQAAGPAPLSKDRGRVDVSSTRGSGVFGRWFVDRFGLPAYRYRIDAGARPARPPGRAGGRADPTDAWSQLGNDHVVANAYNHGYTQLWSQDRIYEWVNRYSAADRQYAGGFGYLRTGGRTISTLYADRPRGARTDADVRRRLLRAGRSPRPGSTVEEHVYAPFGDDPVLLHDVTIRNRSRTRRRASWFEYWGVNPCEPAARARTRGLGAPAGTRAGGRSRSARRPRAATAGRCAIFAAALRGPVAGHATDAGRFFGAGGRASPDAVAADRLDPHARRRRSPPGAAGATLFAFRAPLSISRPGDAVTLRYAYGAAQPGAVPRLVRALARRAAAARPQPAALGAAGCRRPSFGARPRLARRASCSGPPTRCARARPTRSARAATSISQGGYYQYGTFGSQIAFRDPLQHMLPLIYAAPRLARDVLLLLGRAAAAPAAADRRTAPSRSAARRGAAALERHGPVAAAGRRPSTGSPRATCAVFDRRVPYRGGGAASLWRHLKRAYAHQESLRGPHGGYRTTLTGDWSDFSGAFLGMNESTLVSAQLAYVYPRLAELADARGDRAFAAHAAAPRRRSCGPHSGASGRAAGSRAGTARERRIGTGAIFGEPQPWNVLAGVPSRDAGADAGGRHPPLPHRRGRPGRARRAGADRLVAVARRRGSGGDRARAAGPASAAGTPSSWAAPGTRSTAG